MSIPVQMCSMLLVSIALLGAPLRAHSIQAQSAPTVHDSGYFKIKSVHIEEIPDFEQDSISLYPVVKPYSWLDDVSGQLSVADVVVDQIINIGKKIWTVVEAGKPNAQFKSDVATALPAGVLQWQSLQGWRTPVSKKWGISFENIYGVEVVKLVYRVIYLPGGSVDGVGSYIGYASVQPVEVNVAWGYTFNVQASVPSVYNMGTKNNPVAGMTLQVKWTVDTVLKHVEQSQAFAIDGRGGFRQLQ